MKKKKSCLKKNKEFFCKKNLNFFYFLLYSCTFLATKHNTQHTIIWKSKLNWNPLPKQAPKKTHQTPMTNKHWKDIHIDHFISLTSRISMHPNLIQEITTITTVLLNLNFASIRQKESIWIKEVIPITVMQNRKETKPTSTNSPKPISANHHSFANPRDEARLW